MRILLKVAGESIRQAVQQLRGNKLRSFLSLLGISIGIFCIIGVMSAVDSLEDNIRGSMQKLGNDVIYIQKWPWGDNSNNWWDLMKRPHPVYSEYELVKEKSRHADLTAFFIAVGPANMKWNGNTVESAFLCGVSEEFTTLFKLDFESGRFYTPTEYRNAMNRLVIGNKVKQELFGDIDPVGRKVKLRGETFEIVGVLAAAGDELINPLDFDDAILMAYPRVSRIMNTKNNEIETFIAIKASGSMEQLQDELRMIVRNKRRLTPREEDTFSFNELSMVSQVFDSFFSVLHLLGFVIGGFSILVGGVSVANIMFVSVKERTNIIGIKKALGAKRNVILSEFLIESIILCVMGGIVGLLMVGLATTVLTAVLDFKLYIDFGNILRGTALSVIIGVIAGFIPARKAARLDPVEAMRQ